MKYILDTNIVSFAMAGDPEVTARIVASRSTDILLPSPVVAEIEYGLARMPLSKRRERLARNFRILASEMDRAPWTDDVSQAFGQIKASLERKGERIEDFDVAVAAHAVGLHATLVTDNVSHMGRIEGVEIENWKRPSGS
ncbi:MAG: type II toxin-antitoxin system VapC family toxin [Acidobacteriota bacterium]